jgi:hypothetical protein
VNIRGSFPICFPDLLSRGSRGWCGWLEGAGIEGFGVPCETAQPITKHSLWHLSFCFFTRAYLHALNNARRRKVIPFRAKCLENRSRALAQREVRSRDFIWRRRTLLRGIVVSSLAWGRGRQVERKNKQNENKADKKEEGHTLPVIDGYFILTALEIDGERSRMGWARRKFISAFESSSGPIANCLESSAIIEK